ncbi:Lrp/AsnC ligand binding domain-containing protein [Halococcus sp. PRR34]|uniref:Lrp/AsnC family transcriptional regulator n=1 Tax=Halococcus sp. PRR34 TaxID=3020830 RepID=UPI00235F80EB|nr:Lrp/AsnC ligand binding domain-containing protein [Halococcus sp. PRR34]
MNALSREQWGGLNTFAETLGVPVSTIQDRVRHLENTGVITGYIPRLNYEAFGLDVTAIFELDVVVNALTETTARLREKQRLMAIYRVTGGYDLVAVGRCENPNEMNEQVHAFVTNPDIKRTNASVVFETIREFEPMKFE